MGALKVGGAVAVIIGIFMALNGPLDEAMNKEAKIEAGVNAAAKINEQSKRADQAESERDQAKRDKAVAERHAADLENQAKYSNFNSTSAMIARVAASVPGDQLADGILQLE